MASFNYTIYIKASQAQVWAGLTEPEYTNQWWRHELAGGKRLISEWKEGSTWALAHDEVGLIVEDPEQVVLEAEPYSRLSFTWHSFTPAWVVAVGMDEKTAEVWRGEARSKVAFDIVDAWEGVTRLTVEHAGFQPDSVVLGAISEGWPAVLSSLKTLLETGRALP